MSHFEMQQQLERTTITCHVLFTFVLTWILMHGIGCSSIVEETDDNSNDSDSLSDDWTDSVSNETSSDEGSDNIGTSDTNDGTSVGTETDTDLPTGNTNIDSGSESGSEPGNCESGETKCEVYGDPELNESFLFECLDGNWSVSYKCVDYSCNGTTCFGEDEECDPSVDKPFCLNRPGDLADMMFECNEEWHIWEYHQQCNQCEPNTWLGCTRKCNEFGSVVSIEMGDQYCPDGFICKQKPNNDMYCEPVQGD